MERSEKLNLIGAFSVACLWFGTHVGPGFAGGAQIVSYFVKYGWVGVFLGPLAVMAVCIFFIYFLLEYSRLTDSRNFRVFYDRIFGKGRIFFANLKELLTFIGCFVVCAMTYATGGSLLEMLLGIPYVIGGVITIVVVVALVMFGEAIVLRSSLIITVALILMVLYVALIGIGPSWSGMSSYVGSRTMHTDGLTAWYNMLLYIPVFASFMDAGMANSKGVLRNSKDSLATAIMGAVMVGGCLMIMCVLFSSAMPGIAEEALPTLWVLQNNLGVGQGVTALYAIMAFLALVSTGVGFMSGALGRYDAALAKVWKKPTKSIRRAVITIVFMIASIIFGQFGVLDLINYGYKYMGYLNLPLLMLPLMVLLPVAVVRIKKKKKELGVADWDELPDGK